MPWAVAAAALTTAGSLYSADKGAGAAKDAAAAQQEAARLGIDELHGAFGPSVARMDEAQAWSDRQLRNQFQGGMAETRRYADAGARGLGRLNYLMGLDNGLGPQPTAPTAPKQPKALKPPKYDKDPKKAAAQKAAYDKAVVAQQKAYEKSQRVYGRAKTKYDADSASWQAGTAAQASDPTFGSLMKPYDDRFEGQINDVAKRQYVDKYGQEILDTARDKFDAADFQADPGYEFRRSEGNRGIEQSAAAHGSLQSGASLKELNRFNQDTASNEFDRAHSRWADQRNAHLAGVTGQQGFDYGVFDKQKGTELNTLINERDFDFGNFDSNRKFDYGALTGMVGVGQQATDDRNQLREYFGTARTQNARDTAIQEGTWQQNMAGNIAELLGQSGNAQAAGHVGAANAQTNAFQSGSNTLATLAGYYYGGNNRGGIGSGQRRSAPGAPEWWRQNRGEPT
jgi:hypothetical protein